MVIKGKDQGIIKIIKRSPELKQKIEIIKRKKSPETEKKDHKNEHSKEVLIIFLY